MLAQKGLVPTYAFGNKSSDGDAYGPVSHSGRAVRYIGR